jgi:hypothetical protein
MIFKAAPTTRSFSAFMTAIAIAGVPLTGASIAAAQVSVAIDVAPEVTIGDPVEVRATTEPPDPIYEEQTDMPGPGYAWVGGYWGWTGSDWGWYGGRWLAVPAGQVYIEPYYERVGPNVVFVRGYWGPPGTFHHSYGGERIAFVAPGRPVDYRRGEPPRFERRVGAPPGTRPAGFYQHAVGPMRLLPRATAPEYRATGHEAPHEAIRPQPGPGREVAAGRDPGAVHERAMAPHEMPVAHEAPAFHAPPPRAAPAQAPAPRKRK